MRRIDKRLLHISSRNVLTVLVIINLLIPPLIGAFAPMLRPFLEPVALAADETQGPSIKIAESDNRHMRASVAFGKARRSDVRAGGELFTRVEVPGVPAVMGEPGLPAVPVLRRLVGVPQGASVSIKMMGNPVVTDVMRLNLYPFQQQPLDQEEFPSERFQEPPFTKDEKAYASDAMFPEKIVSVHPVGQFRDLQIAQIEIAAGQYNPVTDQLNLYGSLDFEVTFEGGDGAFVTDDAQDPFESAYSVYEGAVLNKLEISQYVKPRVFEIRCSGEEFLILTHPDFRAAADRLAQWKRDKGITTNVINVADGPTRPGPDTNEAIDDLIEFRYDSCDVRPSYVLLMGDAEYIPTFYVHTDAGSPTTGSDYQYAVYPSAPDDNLPDFALGRIPVDTLDQANTVVDKIIGYESRPPSLSSFYENASFASQFQCCRDDVTNDGTDQRTFIEVSEFARNELLNRGYTVERIYTMTVDSAYAALEPFATAGRDTTPRYYYDGTALPADLGPGSGFMWNGVTLNIIDAFNAGRFLILHRDHGWEDGWGSPQFTSSHVTNTLTNGDLLPVVFSVNCASGLFDNETAGGDYGTTVGDVYFAERLLRKADGGAVGILGDTRNSPSWPNTALTKGFFDAVWPNTLSGFGDSTSKRRLGDILNHGKLFMLTQIGMAGAGVSAQSATDELYLWHVIGDPTLQMWTSEPSPYLIIPTYRFELYPEFILVYYEVEGATITAFQMTKDGVRNVGRGEVKDGVANLSYTERPLSDLPILLSASKEDAIGHRLPVLTGLTLSPSTVVGGSCQTSLGRVTLDAPAPAGGVVITLTNTNPAATVPPSVTIPAGASSQTFTVTTSAVAATQTGTVKASFSAVSKTATLSVRPVGVQSVALSPNPVLGGNYVTGTVTLECAAAPGNVVVTLSSSNPSVAKPTVASIVVPAGSRTMNFTVSTARVGAVSTATISATANAVTRGRSLTVNP